MHGVGLRLLAEGGDEAVVVRVKGELTILQVEMEVMDAEMGGQELAIEVMRVTGIRQLGCSECQSRNHLHDESGASYRDLSHWMLRQPVSWPLVRMR